MPPVVRNPDTGATHPHETGGSPKQGRRVAGIAIHTPPRRAEDCGAAT